MLFFCACHFEAQQVLQFDGADVDVWQGYLSLAQANFHNSSTTTRYGQDCYDERMQAIRNMYVLFGCFSFQDNPFHLCHVIPMSISHHHLHPLIPNQPTNASSTINASSLDDSSPDTQRLSFSVSSLSNGNGKPKEGVSEKQDDHPTPSESESKPESEPEKKTTNPVRDPIRWFGILVPQALRSAQASFIQAVEGPIPELATVARELRGLEVEIGRVRKQIKKL